MQRSGATPTQNAAPYFSSTSSLAYGNYPFGTTSASSTARPRTSSGGEAPPIEQQRERPNVLTKERRPSLGRRSSFSKRRASSSGGARPSISDLGGVPPLPDYALASAAKLSRETEALLASPASSDSFPRMLARTAPLPANGYAAAGQAQLAPPAVVTGQNESSVLHQHIQEMANKRISTLDYLRKA
jgi:hypothetical protein